MDDDRRLFFINQNIHQLKAKGIYEAAMLNAWTSVKDTWLFYFDFHEILEMFKIVDRDKMINAGDSIPDQTEFTLYRGVSGTGAARNKLGLSWTSSPNIAAWYALRYAYLDDPAVFTMNATLDDILVYSNDRYDQTYLVMPSTDHKIARLKTMPDILKPPVPESLKIS